MKSGDWVLAELGHFDFKLGHSRTTTAAMAAILVVSGCQVAADAFAERAIRRIKPIAVDRYPMTARRRLPGMRIQ